MAQKKALLLGSLATVLFSVFSLLAGPPEAAAQAPIKVAYIGELTGTLGRHGTGVLRGTQLFVDDLNAKGGVLGRKIELLVKDDKTTPAESVKQMRDAVLTDKVDFVIQGVSSASCLADSSIAQQQKVLLIGNCMTEAFTVDKGHRYVFRVHINTMSQARAGARFLSKNLPDKTKYFTLGHDFEFGHRMVDTFLAEMRKLKPDIQVVGQVWPKLGESDYSPYITAILQARPEVLYTALAEYTGLHKQGKPFGLHERVLTVTSAWGGEGDLVVLGRDTPEGHYHGGYPPRALEQSPRGREFVSAYKARFGEDPWSANLFGYQSALFLIEAIKKAGTADKEKVIDALEGLSLDTAMGKVTIRPFDHQGNAGIWIGKTRFDPSLGYGVLVDSQFVWAEDLLLTEEEVKKVRQAAR